MEHVEEFDDDVAVRVVVDAQVLALLGEEILVGGLPGFEGALAFGVGDLAVGLLEADDADLAVAQEGQRFAASVAHDRQVAPLGQVDAFGLVARAPPRRGGLLSVQHELGEPVRQFGRVSEGEGGRAQGGDVVLAEHGLQRSDVAEVAGAHPERL
jgi:hypothetical protein